MKIKKLPKRLHIADFGCGEAKIMESLHDRIIYSFDHVAINDKVISCNMKSVPLSEEELDVAIFSISLMGRDWRDYIVEAKRCLATNGYLFIAETTKSLMEGGRLTKLRDVLKKEGFDIESDEEIGDFTFIEAREYR